MLEQDRQDILRLVQLGIDMAVIDDMFSPEIVHRVLHPPEPRVQQQQQQSFSDDGDPSHYSGSGSGSHSGSHYSGRSERDTRDTNRREDHGGDADGDHSMATVESDGDQFMSSGSTVADDASHDDIVESDIPTIDENDIDAVPLEEAINEKDGMPIPSDSDHMLSTGSRGNVSLPSDSDEAAKAAESLDLDDGSRSLSSDTDSAGASIGQRVAIGSTAGHDNIHGDEDDDDNSLPSHADSGSLDGPTGSPFEDDATIDTSGGGSRSDASSRESYNDNLPNDAATATAIDNRGNVPLPSDSDFDSSNSEELGSSSAPIDSDSHDIHSNAVDGDNDDDENENLSFSSDSGGGSHSGSRQNLVAEGYGGSVSDSVGDSQISVSLGDQEKVDAHVECIDYPGPEVPGLHVKSDDPRPMPSNLTEASSAGEFEPKEATESTATVKSAISKKKIFLDSSESESSSDYSDELSVPTDSDKIPATATSKKKSFLDSSESESGSDYELDSLVDPTPAAQNSALKHLGASPKKGFLDSSDSENVSNDSNGDFVGESKGADDEANGDDDSSPPAVEEPSIDPLPTGAAPKDTFGGIDTNSSDNDSHRDGSMSLDSDVDSQESQENHPRVFLSGHADTESQGNSSVDSRSDKGSNDDDQEQDASVAASLEAGDEALLASTGRALSMHDESTSVKNESLEGNGKERQSQSSLMDSNDEIAREESGSSCGSQVSSEDASSQATPDSGQSSSHWASEESDEGSHYHSFAVESGHEDQTHESADSSQMDSFAVESDHAFASDYPSASNTDEDGTVSRVSESQNSNMISTDGFSSSQQSSYPISAASQSASHASESQYSNSISTDGFSSSHQSSQVDSFALPSDHPISSQHTAQNQNVSRVSESQHSDIISTDGFSSSQQSSQMDSFALPSDHPISSRHTAQNRRVPGKLNAEAELSRSARSPHDKKHGDGSESHSTGSHGSFSEGSVSYQSSSENLNVDSFAAESDHPLPFDQSGPTRGEVKSDDQDQGDMESLDGSESSEGLFSSDDESNAKSFGAESENAESGTSPVTDGDEASGQEVVSGSSSQSKSDEEFLSDLEEQIVELESEVDKIEVEIQSLLDVGTQVDVLYAMFSQDQVDRVLSKGITGPASAVVTDEKSEENPNEEKAIEADDDSHASIENEEPSHSAHCSSASSEESQFMALGAKEDPSDSKASKEPLDDMTANEQQATPDETSNDGDIVAIRQLLDAGTDRAVLEGTTS